MLFNMIMLELSLGPKDFDELLKISGKKQQELSRLLNYLLGIKQVMISNSGKYYLSEASLDFVKNNIMHDFAFTNGYAGMNINYLKINNLEKILLENMFKELGKFITGIQNKKNTNKDEPAILIWGKSIIDARANLG